MNNGNEVNWPETLWKDINDGVEMEVNKVRVAQKVFPTKTFEDDPAQVANEVIKFDDLSIKDGDTKVFVEIFVNFTLVSNQVMQETKLMTGQTLAKMAAKVLALAEDKYFFQTGDRAAVRDPSDAARGVKLPGNAQIENWRFQDDLGLLAHANANRPEANDNDPNKLVESIHVPLSGGTALWGENTFAAVADGITKLVSKGQAKEYALILPTKVYADTFDPPSPQSLVTTAERIRPLVEGGFYTSGILPDYEGLLIALAGEPIRLYVGRKPAVEFIRKDGAKYQFRVVERVQYVVRDPRALVFLKFEDPSANAVAAADAARVRAAAAANEANLALAEARVARGVPDDARYSAALANAYRASESAALASRESASAAARADNAGRQEASNQAALAAASARDAATHAAEAAAL